MMAEIFETRPYNDLPYLVVTNKILRVKLGDTLPSLRAFVYQKGNLFGDPLPLELAGLTIVLNLYDNRNQLVSAGLATVSDTDRAEIEYIWKKNDFRQTGVYYAEFTFKDIDDTTFTLQLNDRIQIIVF
jgi:hypothetical protein